MAAGRRSWQREPVARARLSGQGVGLPGMATRRENELRFTSCMAPVADVFFRGVADVLGRRLGIRTTVVDDRPWPERERLFDDGMIEVCWICGYPYVQKIDGGGAAIEILASPLMRDPRYGDEPVYFSDVVVRRDSPWTRLEQLRGATFAYNEPRSHSGAWIVRHALATRGWASGFFGRLVESGAHETSLRLVELGVAAASAIDSTVLELEERRRPGLTDGLRVIDTLGPSPIPPWVIHRSVPERLRDELRETLLGLHEDPEGRAVLEPGGVARFVTRRDPDYDPIRRMAIIGQGVPWP